MAKTTYINYVFDASAKTIQFIDYPSGSLLKEYLFLITNVETGDIIYFFKGGPGLSGSIASNAGGDILTLDFDTTTMDDADALQIVYDDGAYPATESSLNAVNNNTYDIKNKLPAALGQTTKSGSLPVTLASDQEALPLPTGAATSAKQDTEIGHLSTISGKDFATQTTLATRLSESDFDTKIGSLTESAPGTDTASSGLNGRLQRIAQRITSLIALLPTALTGSGNFKVAVQEAIPAGTNNIGDVDVLTLPALPAGTNNIGDVDVVTLPAIPAGTNLIGKTSSADRTDTIFNGTTELTPKYAILTTSSSGNTSLVASVASKKIRVLAYNLMANGTVNVKFQSNTTDISALGYLVANTGKVCNYNPHGWFETASGVALNLNLSAAIAVSVEITYIEV